jgi:anti-sigma factor RsiW
MTISLDSEEGESVLPAENMAAWRWSWTPKLAAAAAFIFIAFLLFRGWSSYPQAQTFAGLADLHVATLASATPVDVISTDRHTVKPWFQGKLPFTFNLPELGDTPFTLEGGRMSYLGQSPGAQLIFKIGNHRISVFIFQNRLDRRSLSSGGRSRRLTFNVEAWTEGDLRYFVIGDADPNDIHKLSELLKMAARS